MKTSEIDTDLLDEILDGVKVNFTADFDFEQIVESLQSFGIEVRPWMGHRLIYPELQYDHYNDPDRERSYKVDTLANSFHADNAAGEAIYLCHYTEFNTWSMDDEDGELHEEGDVNKAIREFILSHVKKIFINHVTQIV